MLGRTYEGQNCSAARALECVGERWTLLILRDSLLRNMTRFTEFRDSLGIARNVLATRLDHLVDTGLLTRERYSAHPDQYAYRPTAKARDVVPIIVALTTWGDRWAAPAGPPVEFTHATCGHPVAQAVTCPTCGEAVPAADVRARPGPGSGSGEGATG